MTLKVWFEIFPDCNNHLTVNDFFSYKFFPYFSSSSYYLQCKKERKKSIIILWLNICFLWNRFSSFVSFFTFAHVVCFNPISKKFTLPIDTCSTSLLETSNLGLSFCSKASHLFQNVLTILLQWKMNFQDLYGMQSIFYYSQKTPISSYCLNIASFLSYLLWGSTQEGSWLGLQISGTELIEDWWFVTGYLSFTMQCGLLMSCVPHWTIYSMFPWQLALLCSLSI